MNGANVSAEEPRVLPFFLRFDGVAAEVAAGLATLDHKEAVGRPVMAVAEFRAAHCDERGSEGIVFCWSSQRRAQGW